MAEEKIVAAETVKEQEVGLEERQEIVVKMEKPYLFEGKEYSEIDLNGLHNLTIKDAIETQRQLFGEQEVGFRVDRARRSKARERRTPVQTLRRVKKSRHWWKV